jgi:hypothetical protein
MNDFLVGEVTDEVTGKGTAKPGGNFFGEILVGE